MANGCHTGFSVFFTTSVLWQMVNLEHREDKLVKRDKSAFIFKYSIKGNERVSVLHLLLAELSRIDIY